MDEATQFEVPGKDISETPYASSANDILRRVRELCSWGRPTFPGSQPVSLSASNMRELGRNAYVACEKTDGVRYLMLAASRLVFLIDRKETVRVLELTLPQKGLELDESGRVLTQQATLLDGEMVKDIVHTDEGVETRISFLIFDAICVNREISIAKMNYLERLKTALIEVIKPRLEFEQKFKTLVDLEIVSNNYVPIYLKDFYEIWDVMAIRNFSKRLPHLSDGIIFTPVSAPYIPGTCKSLFKWKPPELNTLDFASELVFASDIDGYQVPVAAKLLIGSRGLRRDSGNWIAISRGRWDAMVERHLQQQDCDGSIWECYWDKDAVTLVPKIDTNDRSQAAGRWQKYWSSKVGQKRRQTATLSPEQVRKAMRGALEDMRAVDTNAEDEMRIEIPDTYPANVCPLTKTRDGLYFYDFTHAQIVQGGWVLERIRTDKTTPNDERVMSRVKESIESGIDITLLFDHVLGLKKVMQPVNSYCSLPPYYQQHGSKAQKHADGDGDGTHTHGDGAQTDIETEKMARLPPEQFLSLGQPPVFQRSSLHTTHTDMHTHPGHIPRHMHTQAGHIQEESLVPQAQSVQSMYTSTPMGEPGSLDVKPAPATVWEAQDPTAQFESSSDEESPRDRNPPSSSSDSE